MQIIQQFIALVAALCITRVDAGLHTQFLDEVTGESLDIQLHVEGYTGEIEYHIWNTTEYRPTTRYKTLADLSTPLEERDVCQAVASCFTNGAYNFVLWSQTVTWANTQGNCVALGNSIYNYFVANNYANTNTIIQQGVVTVALWAQCYDKLIKLIDLIN